MKPWEHQLRGVQEVQAAIDRGERRIVLSSPTGMGKTLVMIMLVTAWLAEGLKVVLYSNRRLLITQLCQNFATAGVAHGVRAAGEVPDLDENFQISSIQTEVKRVLGRQCEWQLHEADRVLVDEGHLQTGDGVQQILGAHREQGASVVAVTATPIGLGPYYDCLIQAGTVSEGRACGALVPARHYGPDEPDLRAFKLKVGQGEDLTENQQRKVMGGVGKDGQADERLHATFGRVLEWFEQLNPERRPTILFAPGVKESIWFAEQFSEAGVPAAHIDGASVWADGRLERSNGQRRAEILEASKNGQCVVLCNRFVLREGIDAPWLSHGIFATVFGSLQSYLQSGGRLLRYHPGVEHVTIQDHGGNWWRHGSLNADRVWSLDGTAAVVTGMYQDHQREHPEAQPVRCPKCSMVRVWKGPRCPTCGHELPRSAVSRPVVQLDGTLKLMKGDVFKKRRLSKDPDGPALWEKMYHRSRTQKGERTFRAAAALFALENKGAWPDPSWPLMPTSPRDWHQLVRDVPRERLTQ